MAQFDIIMPKMGESIEEATITKWFVKEGDKVVEDDVLLEIATDKVDSEIPSPVEGVVKKVLYQQDDTIAVGTVIAVIDMGGGEESDTGSETKEQSDSEKHEEKSDSEQQTHSKGSSQETELTSKQSESGRFYSPLVRKIAKEEGVTSEELDSIKGSGLNNRVQKKDILEFIETRESKG